MRDQVRVLHVCTGNLCRSPLASYLMSALLSTSAGDVAIACESAGTAAVTGAPMAENAERILHQRGINAGGFTAQPLSSDQVVSADLVLTATRAHRLAVLQADPSARERTFTLLEFARLAADVDPHILKSDRPAERLLLLRDAVLMLRGTTPSIPSRDDLADPYGRRRSRYARCASAIDLALESIAGRVLLGRLGEVQR